MIRLRVDEAAAIPLAVESASPVSMTVKEEFIDRGGASIQSNKNATPGTAAVVVTPDSGYDAMAKVTVEAVPQGALSPIDIDFDDSTGAFTAEARVGTSGYIPDSAFVGGGFQLATQAAATITPTTVQQQAVAAHKYTTGAVVVDPIPSEYIVPSGTKNITANGNAQDVKSYEKVNVNVPNSYAAADEGKVVQSGALVSQSSQTIDTNGTYDTTTKNEVVVDVQSGGGGMVEIASGTLTGAGQAVNIDIPLGKKMPQRNFAFRLLIDPSCTITSDGNYYVMAVNDYIAYPNYIDMSAAGTNTMKTELYINNGARMVIAGTRYVVTARNINSFTYSDVGNTGYWRYKRDNTTGFSISIQNFNSLFIFKSGEKYNWSLIYFGNDPTNDIVEIP